MVEFEYNGIYLNIYKEDIPDLRGWLRIHDPVNYDSCARSEGCFDCDADCESCPFCLNYYSTTQKEKMKAINKLYSEYITSPRGNEYNGRHKKDTVNLFKNARM